VSIDGKIISVIHLRAGLQDRLTLKDNTLLVGSFFGLTQKEIKERFNSIVKFAELESFTETKVYQFSEGMKQRLAFSIAIHCNPDILLLDEIFEVGDEKFKKKSAEKIKKIVKKGTAVLLVSHDLGLIKRYCNKVILMEKGIKVKEGNVGRILKKYR